MSEERKMETPIYVWDESTFWTLKDKKPKEKERNEETNEKDPTTDNLARATHNYWNKCN